MTTLTATAAGYTATLDTDTKRVSICDADGHWAGDGTWNGRQIEDCPADLGDEAYEALDVALRAASRVQSAVDDGQPIDDEDSTALPCCGFAPANKE